MFRAESITGPASDPATEPSRRVFPNPTTGTFKLELLGSDPTATVSVQIFGIRGERVLSERMTGRVAREFSLAGKAAGVYVVYAECGGKVHVAKLVLAR